MLRLCLFILAILFGANLIFPPPLTKAQLVSPVVLDRQDGWMAGFTVEDGVWRIPADLDDIDPRFVERLIAIEDERFWTHSGVDVPAIFRAAHSWQKAGKPVSGASTISMQLVRQIEPRPRTLRAKIIESLRAIQYEQHLSKREILELYLTHISYGGNIDGIHAATLSYFGKEPNELNDAEIALLIAIPQAPEARRPDRWPNIAQHGRDNILDKLYEKGLIDQRQMTEAKEIPVAQDKQTIPATAWLSAHAIADNHERVRSTFDLDLQNDVEAVVNQYLEGLPNSVNVALTLVENETMAVRAHIASGGRERQGGWLDMTRRYRSPGSTLKPFVYGVAMEDGILASGSWIEDAPRRFGNYQPENFNHRYYGKVRIHEALRHSLNVPAVIVMDRIGGARFESRLKYSGVNLVRLGGDSEEAGLAIALGGAGVTLNDLAVGYAALANGGLAQGLRWKETDPEQATVPLMSQDIANDLTDILRQAPTPGGRVPAWLAEKAPSIAYKTGTSYGFRDAWAAGYTDQWTIVVWVGRPDGAPREGQTGRIAAAPLLFDVFNALPQIDSRLDFERDQAAPKGLSSVDDYTADGPQILFPPHETELLANQFGPKSRGFTFSARTETGEARFFVDGQPISEENGLSIWRPETPGFYRVEAIDAFGRKSVSEISVLSFSQLDDPRF